MDGSLFMGVAHNGPVNSLRKEQRALLDSTRPEYQYASFMVRMWRLANGADQGDPCRWLGEVEHLQSGQRLRFDSLDELPDLLRRQAEAFQST
jgi:hypothetical protein